MMPQTYRLSLAPTYVHDVADDDDLSFLLIEARLRSGDYFVTLASELERLAEVLAEHGNPESEEITRLSSELLYLEKHYRLTSK